MYTAQVDSYPALILTFAATHTDAAFVIDKRAKPWQTCICTTASQGLWWGARKYESLSMAPAVDDVVFVESVALQSQF